MQLVGVKLVKNTDMNKESTSGESKSDDCCKRNRISICLAVSLIIAIGCLVLVSYFFIQSLEIEFCAEPQCVKSSGEINAFIDDSIDPCQDFHGFVCAKYIKTAHEKQQVNPLKSEYDRLENICNSLITEPPSDDDLKPVVMQKKYFQACLDEDEIDKDEDRIFFILIEEIGGWPVLKGDAWKLKDFSWTNVMIKARKLGLPFDWFLNIDLHESDQYNLKISYSKICDKSDDYLTQDYISLMSDIIMNVKGTTIREISEVNKIFNFEKQLVMLCGKTKNANVTVGTINSLDDKWPAINWIEFMRNITGSAKKWKRYSKVAYDIDDYLPGLYGLLKKTSKRVQANYIVWKIIEYFAPYLSKETRETYMNYIEKTTGEETDRFQFCLRDTKSRFQFVSDIVYIRNQATEEIKEAGKELVDSIKEQLIDQIQNSEWMDEDTKGSLLETYDMEDTIGGSDVIFNEEIFSKYLHVGQLNFESNNTILMLTEWSLANFASKMEMIGKTSIESDLNQEFMANAVHSVLLSPKRQRIIVPATMLQGFFYDIDCPQYLNYGGLGGIVGLQMAGNLENSNNNVTDNHGFEENRQCENLNASQLALLNYDDLIGRDIAYRAYQKFVEENGEELPLVGLPYSPNQLFWIKSSLNYCYRYSPNEEIDGDDLEQTLKNRIIETVRNSPFFADDFNCPQGSPMNPEKKCRIF